MKQLFRDEYIYAHIDALCCHDNWFICNNEQRSTSGQERRGSWAWRGWRQWQPQAWLRGNTASRTREAAGEYLCVSVSVGVSVGINVTVSEGVCVSVNVCVYQ